MKKNETNPTEVMKFFREQREARQLQAMNYGGVNDPTKKVDLVTGDKGVITNAQPNQVTSYPRPKRKSRAQIEAEQTGRY